MDPEIEQEFGMPKNSKQTLRGATRTIRFHHFGATWLISVPSKLPAANSRSGSTEGHGASGNLFSTGVLSVVCGFSSKLDVKKHGSRRKIL